MADRRTLMLEGASPLASSSARYLGIVALQNSRCGSSRNQMRNSSTKTCQREGLPLGDSCVKKAWKKACTQGLPELHLHDLRRSAVRNMDRAGIPRAVAMRISGHRTESMYHRYNIVSERDLAGVKDEDGAVLV